MRRIGLLLDIYFNPHWFILYNILPLNIFHTYKYIDMPVSKGSRVFVKSEKMFGEVTKLGALGTDAVVVECDDGSLHVMCGEHVKSDIVDKDTSKDGNGLEVSLPTDVRVIGPAILESFGVDEQTRAALFQKFLLLDESVRLEKAAYWETNQNDESKMKSFLEELIDVLREDETFIKIKSAKLLRHLGEDTRNTMLTNMMSLTTVEERKAMIMQYTSIQNDRRKVSEFLQGMYELLLDNKSYIMNEFTRVLGEESTSQITEFIANSTSAQHDDIVQEWRKRKLYRSSAGGAYARNVINQ